jgi:hypothetical protein
MAYEIFGLLGYYTALCGNCLPTFRDNVSVQSSRVKIPTRLVAEWDTYLDAVGTVFQQPLLIPSKHFQ